MKPLVTRFILSLLAGFLATATTSAQDLQPLIQKVRAKIEQVNNYVAQGTLKTNVTFLKVPVAQVNVYFKKPDKLKIKNEKGISFIPRGAVSISTGSLFNGNNFTLLDAGYETISGIRARVIKMLPQDDNADIVLSTIYVDEAALVILRAKTTTRENGSYELDMKYGKYASWGLPDKLVFSFNAKDYKLPKGVTFDFDDGSQTTPKQLEKNKKGRAEIIFKSYTINQGVPDSVFQ